MLQHIKPASQRGMTSIILDQCSGLGITTKKEYCEHYGVTHSKCYTQYGLVRTGCFGCLFGKRFEDELESMKQHEPKLLMAANNIFGESYDYTRRYLAFREEMKRKSA